MSARVCRTSSATFATALEDQIVFTPARNNRRPLVVVGVGSHSQTWCPASRNSLVSSATTRVLPYSALVDRE